jgi:hypothetical protein
VASLRCTLASRIEISERPTVSEIRVRARRRFNETSVAGYYAVFDVGGVLLTNGFFRLALDLAQTPAEQVAFIDNTAMFVKIAEDLGMRGIVHKDHKSTRAKLASFGLQADGGDLQETEQRTQSGVERMTAEVFTQL